MCIYIYTYIHVHNMFKDHVHIISFTHSYAKYANDCSHAPLDDFCSLTMVKPSSFAPMARVIKRASLTPACDEDRWGSPAGIPKPSSPTTTCAHSSKMTDPQSSWFSLALVDQLGKKTWVQDIGAQFFIGIPIIAHILVGRCRKLLPHDHPLFFGW